MNRGIPLGERCRGWEAPFSFAFESKQTVYLYYSNNYNLESQRRTLPSIYDTPSRRLSSSKLRNQLPSTSLKAALLTLNHLNRQYGRQPWLNTLATYTRRNAPRRCSLSLEEGTAIRVEIDSGPDTNDSRSNWFGCNFRGLLLHFQPFLFPSFRGFLSCKSTDNAS